MEVEGRASSSQLKCLEDYMYVCLDLCNRWVGGVQQMSLAVCFFPSGSTSLIEVVDGIQEELHALLVLFCFVFFLVGIFSSFVANRGICFACSDDFMRCYRVAFMNRPLPVGIVFIIDTVD